MTRYPIITAFVVLSSFTPLGADTLYRCPGPDGVPLFANQPCDEHSKPLELPEIGVIGSDDGGVELRRRLHAMERIADLPARKERSTESSPGLTFGQRMALRQLEIRRDGLQRDVRNQALASSFRKSLSKELSLVKQRIRILEKQR
ncbi:hypothetical protein [Alcanivorax sp. 1008]|uniref:hypothetical protein n=1 Tax=Alcanivorax sp. 1008 TaxID=2816853 RepID=UPI001D68E207|nr:hypothetical protein [Alcanivorax sp. 1008]MCC1496189.1 hypothetical protein [Alcanivorax sp. 1008]